MTMTYHIVTILFVAYVLIVTSASNSDDEDIIEEGQIYFSWSLRPLDDALHVTINIERSEFVE